MRPLTTILTLAAVLTAWQPHTTLADPATKPFHFAHRGGAHEFEENTLYAFRSSYEKGIRGFELDIRMTKDGHLVVLHDDSLDRTHHGTGPVEHLTADQARQIHTKKQNEPLLFLDTFLDYLKDKPGIYVEFEMKTRNEKLYPAERIQEYTRLLHQKVTAHIPEGSTYIFTSFDPRPLISIKSIDPQADIMLIKGGPLTPELMENARAIGSRRIAAKMEGTTRLAVREAQKQGFIVTGWPGHTLEDYFLGLGLGVDAICSDVPVLVQEYIDKKK